MTGYVLSGGADIVARLWEGVGGLAPGLVAMAIQGTVVLLVAFSLGWALRRRSAAARHLAWSVGLVALVAVPVGGSVLRSATVSWTVPMIQRAAGAARGSSTSAGMAPRSRRSAVVEAPAAAVRPSPPPPAPAPGTPPASDHGTAGKGGAPVATALRFASIVHLAGAAVLLFLAALARGTIRRRLSRAERIAPDDPIAREVRRGVREVGLRRKVRVRVGAGFGVPLVVGALRPIVHLPAGARGWPPARRRAALLHELAHVGRADAWWGLAADLACALHWWNPLAWAAARRARLESERACDDQVVRSGVRPSDYGAQLLWLAGGRSAPWWRRAATGMAGSPRLARRIDALADGSRPRGGVGWAGGLAAGALGLAALPLALLGPAAADGEEAPTTRAASAPPAPASSIPPAAIPAAPEGRPDVEGARSPGEEEPVQARWSAPEGTGVVFLEGSVRLAGSAGTPEEAPGAGGAASGLFLLFHVGPEGALRSLRAHAGPGGPLRRFVRDGGGLRAVSERVLADGTPWVADALAGAGRRLAGRGESVVWRGRPLGREGEPRSGPRLAGSVMTGSPAISRDPGAGTFVAGWRRNGRRLGAFGRRRGPDGRIPDLERLRDGEWLVAFSWDPGTRELRVLEASGRGDGPPLLSYSVNGEPRAYEHEGRAWVAPLLPELERLVDF